MLLVSIRYSRFTYFKAKLYKHINGISLASVPDNEFSHDSYMIDDLIGMSLLQRSCTCYSEQITDGSV